MRQLFCGRVVQRPDAVRARTNQEPAGEITQGAATALTQGDPLPPACPAAFSPNPAARLRCSSCHGRLHNSAMSLMLAMSLMRLALPAQPLERR